MHGTKHLRLWLIFVPPQGLLRVGSAQPTGLYRVNVLCRVMHAMHASIRSLLGALCNVQCAEEEADRYSC